MNNIDKYKNSINKIEIDENMVKTAMEKAREHKKRSDVSMEKKMKIGSLGKTIITVATLLSISVASYASYVAITGNTIFKKSTVQLEGEDTEVNTIQFNGVEDNGVFYTIECPSDIVMKNDGEADIYESIYNNEENENGVTLPDVYMKVFVVNANQIKGETVGLIEEVNKYKENYSSIENNVKVGVGQYDATIYHINSGLQWNSEIKDIYVININENKSMIIEIAYFMEANEGWGAKFNQLVVNTLEIDTSM